MGSVSAGGESLCSCGTLAELITSALKDTETRVFHPLALVQSRLLQVKLLGFDGVPWMGDGTSSPSNLCPAASLKPSLELLRKTNTASTLKLRKLVQFAIFFLKFKRPRSYLKHSSVLQERKLLYFSS